MKTAALIAVAGLTAVASAQSVSVNLTHDDADNEIMIGESVTWSLSVGFDGFADGASASGGNMALTGDAVGTSSDLTYSDTNGGNNGGVSTGAGIDFINWTNSLFLEAFSGLLADKSNPFTIGTFEFTGTSVGSVNYALSTGRAISAFASVDVSAFATENFNIEDVALNIDALRVVVPTPASAALLGLGGLVAIRRRR